jgi:hypothetical protein
MPKISERQALIKELNSVLKVMSMWDDDDTSDAEEIFDICALLQSTRFINLRQHVRKNKSMNELLWHYGKSFFFFELSVLLPPCAAAAASASADS